MASVSDSLTVTPLGGGRYRIDEGGHGRVVFAIAQPRHTWVFVDGIVYVVPVETGTGSRRSTSGSDEAALASPMPATVVDVKVTAGDKVAAGDVLVVLEAMKMEVAIKAPGDATVKSIACRAGELVQPGVALLELE